MAALAPDSVVEIGRTSIVFRVVPNASGGDDSAGSRMDDATKRHTVGSWEDV